ncbi:RelA/SpoT family protein [Candidatus Acidulodesulfobacterium sp. H_13]|uniref:RelA/SpoT family protein n=1 Tax=Candidatus Acidulodesulfobacterium sp. H_13 TaxID=3395470 RepID=UPI003AF439C2
MDPDEKFVTVINPSGDFLSLNSLIELFRSNINSMDDVVIEEIHGERFKLFKKAYNFSKKVHHGQKRFSGEPYLTHPIEVAAIVAGLRMDCPSVVAALLHDTVEDTLTTLEDIKREFGEETAFIVGGLTKLGKLSFKSSEELEAENIRKMIVAMAKDIRVIVIKLADRLHNLRTLNFLPRDKQIKIAQETLDIYAPLANRLGIFFIKSELEDLSFKYLNSESYKDLTFKVNKKRIEREKYIEKVSDILMANLKKHKLKAEIYGRPKHFYSIYKKMIGQHVSFEDIYDLLALRIIVNTETECYEALGIVHSIWKPISGRIKDYIAMPKANLYRSLHTTVIGPEGMRVEIQIRTKQMHFIDEFGIAAHWKYKEDMPVEKQDLDRFNWLRQLVEYQRELKDPHEFLDSVKIDLFQDEVYVFTPNGKVIALPKDSTPVDFAYSIHTEIGDKATSAIVNGVIVPLKHKLSNGDIVEIITKEGHYPSRDWLGYVKSSKAISKIRSYIRQTERDESIVSGRENLEREFKKVNNKTISFKELVNQSLQKLSLKTDDDLFAGIGYGKYAPSYIFSMVIPGYKKRNKLSLITKTTGSVINKIIRRIKPGTGRGTAGIFSGNGAIVSSFDGDLLYKLAGCCHPIPGDNILGFISKGRGVIIHKTDCKNIIGMDESRFIQVDWKKALEQPSSNQEFFETKIKIITSDKKGILAGITSLISEKGANISKVQVRTVKDERAIHLFDIEVKNDKQVELILNGIKSIKGVIKVNRVTG